MTLDLQPRRPTDLPSWFPPWASQLADLYFSGTTAAFVLARKHVRSVPHRRRRWPDDTECSPSFSPSSYSGAGRWCCTTTSDAGFAHSLAATSSG